MAENNHSSASPKIPSISALPFWQKILTVICFLSSQTPVSRDFTRISNIPAPWHIF
jgi:hypothetical protein